MQTVPLQIARTNGRYGRSPSDVAVALGVDPSVGLPRQSAAERLRAHGLITRIPGSHRYRVTDTGLHQAMLLTHLQTRLLQPGLAQLTDPNPPAPSTLRIAARDYQRALDRHAREAGFAA